MPRYDSTVCGLLNKRILLLASTQGQVIPDVGIMYNVSINPDFEKYITEKDLGLPMEKDDILKNRPDWAYKYKAYIDKENKRFLLFNGF